MKRKIISIITLLMLIAQMILPGVVNATNERENKTSTDINNTQNAVSTANGDLEIGGNGSFGTLLADSINEQNSDKSNNGQVGITNAEIESNIAKVTYFSNEKATIIVAIYNEEKNKIITTSKKDVDIAKEETEIEIELDGEIPQYFVLKAFMIDKDNNPLCDVYENSTYTQEMQKLLAMTTDDFEPDRVLNIDDKKETNFAIYNEDTVIVKAQESGVTLKSADEEKQIYVFENINDKIRNLKKDDIFSYVIDEEQEIIVKVSKITINGNSATISGGNLELEEVFDYVKIETDTSEAEFEITESEDEGITYLKDNEDNNMFGASADEGEIGFNKKASFLLNILKLKNKDDTEVNNEDEKDDNNENKKEDDNEDSNKDIDQHNAGEVEDSFSISISGKVDIETSISLKYYHSVNETYIEYNDKTKITFSGTISGKISIEIPLATGADLYFPVGSNKKNARVIISYIPKFVIEVGASLTFSTSFETGEKIKVESGKITKTDLPTVLNTDNLYEFKASVFVGFKWEPTVKFAITRKVFSAEIGIKSQLGVEITASYGKSSVDTTGDIKHDCGVCLDGKVNFVVQGSVYGKLSLFETEFSVEKGFNFKYKITDFYISISRGEFGLGICPHKKFLTTFKVVDENGNIVEGAKVSLDNGSICIEEDTDNDGNVFAFLNSGDYFVTVKKENKMAIKKIHVVDKAQTIKIILSKEFDVTDSYILNEGQCGDDAYFVLYNNGVLYIYGEGELWAESNYFSGDTALSDNYWYRDGMIIGVKKLIIDEGITAIGYGTFAGESILEEVMLPSSLKRIGGDSFRGCRELKSIIIPDNVKEIGAYAFCGLTNLNSVKMSKSVKYIGNSAFENTGIKSIDLPKCCYVCSRAFLYCHLEEANIACKTIGAFAFIACSINNLNLKDGVEEIGSYAFVGRMEGGEVIDCNYFDKVTFPNTLKSIGDYSFAFCNFNNNIVFPNSLKNIGNYAFAGCSIGGDNSLNHQLEIPSSVEKIGEYSFRNIKLDSITIGCKEIGEGAFEEGHFKNVHILGTTEKIQGFNRGHIENLIIDNGAKEIGGFYGVEALKEINLPKSIEIIKGGAFGSCYDIENVHISNGIISEQAFYECYNLTNLTMDEGVSYIGSNAFFRCRALHAPFYIPSTVKYIGSNCFGDTDSYSDVILKGEMPEFGKNGDYFAFGGYGILWNDVKRVFYPNTWKELPSYVINVPDVNTQWISYDENDIEGLNKMLEENSDENEITEDNEEPNENEKIENNEEINQSEELENNAEIDESENSEENIESSEQISQISFNAKINNFTSKYEGTSINIENSEEKTSSFNGLVANENYIIYVLKEENTYDMLEKNNLLYIDQGKADENGEISFTYIPKEETENAIVLLYGKENPEKIEEKTYLTGDVNGDGKVSLLDYGLVLSHVKRKKLLTGDMLVRADVNKDNKVSLLDYGLILAHVKRTKLLF